MRHHLDLVHREDHRGGAAAPARARSTPPRSPRSDDAAAAELRPARTPTARAASRSASIASAGKRASRSTSSACGAGDLVGDPPDRRRGTRWSTSTATLMPPASCSSADGAGDRRDALEDAAREHAIGELDVERVLEREHHVDARVRGHARLVEVGVVGERVDVDGQAGVVAEDLADLVGHEGPYRPVGVKICNHDGGRRRPASWVRLTARSETPTLRGTHGGRPAELEVHPSSRIAADLDGAPAGWPSPSGRSDLDAPPPSRRTARRAASASTPAAVRQSLTSRSV